MMTFGQAMKLGAAATVASYASYLCRDRACAIGAALYAIGHRYEGNLEEQLQQGECMSLIRKEWPYTVDAKVNGLNLVDLAEYKFMHGNAVTRDQVAEWVMQWERDHGILVDELQPMAVEEEVGV